MLATACSRRTSRMRSFCWSRVLAAIRVSSGRRSGAAAGRCAGKSRARSASRPVASGVAVERRLSRRIWEREEITDLCSLPPHQTALQVFKLSSSTVILV